MDDIANQDIYGLRICGTEPVSDTVGKKITCTADDTRTSCILNISSYISDLIRKSYYASLECRRSSPVPFGLIGYLSFSLVP